MTRNPPSQKETYYLWTPNRVIIWQRMSTEHVRAKVILRKAKHSAITVVRLWSSEESASVNVYRIKSQTTCANATVIKRSSKQKTVTLHSPVAYLDLQPQSKILRPVHTVCVLCGSQKQTAIISLYSTDWLVFITEMECLLRGRDWIFK
jgi:hypothetical protein